MKNLLLRAAIHAFTLVIMQFMIFVAFIAKEEFLFALALLIFNLMTLSDASQLLEASRRAED